MTGAVMGVMSFGDGEKGYPAACREHRQSLEAEKTKKHSLCRARRNPPADTLA